MAMLLAHAEMPQLPMSKATIMSRPILEEEVYREKLDSLGLGSALWYPEALRGNVRIGDVGFIGGGIFECFFYAPSPSPAHLS